MFGIRQYHHIVVGMVWLPNKPEYKPPVNPDVSIAPDGSPAPFFSGDINLYPQASRVFSQLDVGNVFTAPLNTFQEVAARRMHITSDRTQ